MNKIFLKRNLGQKYVIILDRPKYNRKCFQTAHISLRSYDSRSFQYYSNKC